MRYFVLEACVVIRALSLQGYDVENVVPEEVLFNGVFAEGLAFLLHHLSGHVAYVAVVRLVIRQLLILLTQATKRVKHNTLHDVAKQHSEESAINHIICKPTNLKLFHRLTNSARNIQRHDAIQYIVTHFVNALTFSVDIFHVVAESDSTEHKDEHDTHEADIQQGLDVDGDCFENVS